MRSGRATAVMIALAVIFFAFAAGFFTSRLTAGGTYTISTESGPWGQFHTEKELQPEDGISGEREPRALFPIDINSCGKEELMLLPSIGEVRAERIIAYREENGPFRSIADIMQVSGIGEAIYDDIKEYITCGLPGG